MTERRRRERERERERERRGREESLRGGDAPDPIPSVKR